MREVARQGAARAIVAGAPVAFPRPLPIPVEFVAPGAPPPAGARRERADVVAGIELVDEPARRAAEWKLIRGMNKAFEGPVDALINWRFSMRITRLLARRSLAVTPNQVTVVGLALTFLAAGLVAFGQLRWAGIVLIFAGTCDILDGALARSTKASACASR